MKIDLSLFPGQHPELTGLIYNRETEFKPRKLKSRILNLSNFALKELSRLQTILDQNSTEFCWFSIESLYTREGVVILNGDMKKPTFESAFLIYFSEVRLSILL